MKIHLSKSGYFILMVFDDHRTVEIDFGAKTAKEAMRGYRKEHDDVLRYMTRSVTLTLIRRAEAGDTIMAGPEKVQGQAHAPRHEIARSAGMTEEQITGAGLRRDRGDIADSMLRAITIARGSNT